jgi:cytidylate kinase
MIYLIGGAPRCGKTTIAKKLSKKLLISWISADTIESMIATNTSSRDIIKLFPKSIIRK